MSMIGTAVGPYHVTAKLGAGGMGEVYRARDSKLKREVALKVLPADVASDGDRLARFQREAEVLAALNHPNIAQIYGLEEVGSGGASVPPTAALVMELVEGEDLAQRIARGPIPLQDALPVARQIADALEAAHELGIVHRDLKPANIKVRPDGTVKVLDFGLAKALDRAGGAGGAGRAGGAGGASGAGADEANSPTITTPAMTHAGMILGTAAYMSPEQARGKPVDRRTDIWAFGCVLYEMLTARRAFEGETVTDVLGAIVHKDPDWAKLPGQVPASIRTLLERCLRKDRARRLDSAAAVRIEIEEAGEPHAEHRAGPPAPAARRGPGTMGIAAAIAGLALAAGWGVGRITAGGPPPASDSVVVAQIPAPPGVLSAFHDGFALAPDAGTLAFIARNAGGRRQLWLRSIDNAAARPVPGTEGAAYPFWSPDGEQLGFVAGSTLRRVPRAGGTSQVLADVRSTVSGGSWSARGDIVFDGRYEGAQVLRLVRADGGTVASLDLAGVAPKWLASGERFLFAAQKNDGWAVLTAAPGAAGEATVVAGITPGPEGGYAYAASGYLFANRNGALLAHRFDARAGTTGDPIAIAGAVGSPRGWFAMSAAAGTVVALAGNSPDEAGDPGDPMARLQWVNRAGQVVGEVGEPGRYWTVDLAPDGQRVLAREGVALWSLGGRSPARLLGDGNLGRGVWSPDGSSFASVRFNTGELLRYPVASPATAESLGNIGPLGTVTDWSPDGRSLLVSTWQSANADIAVFDVATRRLRSVVATASSERAGRYSPDGRWIAYSSNTNGRSEVFVTASDGTGRTTQVSQRGGEYPMWGKNGRELYFINAEDEMFALSVSAAGGALTFGEETRLFRIPLNDITRGVAPPYAVSADGERFLLNVPGPPSSLLYIRGFDRMGGTPK